VEVPLLGMQHLQCGFEGNSVAAAVVLVAAATSPPAAPADLVVYYSGKEGVGLFGGYCLLLGQSMQFVVQSFVFGSYCSLQFCLRLYRECSAQNFPMCWLEKNVAYTVLGLFAVFFMCRNLSLSLSLMICVCIVCVLELDSC
jgi:hypothetical protein